MKRILSLALVLIASCSSSQQPQSFETVMSDPPFTNVYYCNPPAGYDACPQGPPYCDPEMTLTVDEECMAECCEEYTASMQAQFTLMCNASTLALNEYR